MRKGNEWGLDGCLPTVEGELKKVDPICSNLGPVDGLKPGER